MVKGFETSKRESFKTHCLYLLMDHISIPISQGVWISNVFIYNVLSFAEHLHIYLLPVYFHSHALEYIINTLCLFHHNRGIALLVEATDPHNMNCVAGWELRLGLLCMMFQLIHMKHYIFSYDWKWYILCHLW